ncbi:MAG: metallophosphoesterase, partial [Kiritimatiellae bacterium]|nr:metallophosphoesterase [Kiritimatiellia bacterium]
MNCGRLEFMRGGAAFFVAAGLGNRAFGGVAAAARLRVGVLSDIHVFDGAPDDPRSVGTCDMFEKALRYFASRSVDVVVVAGDMADSGLVS